MSHWNYRLWKITGENEDWIELRETYYNSNGEICACVERASDMVFYSKDLDEISDVINRMHDDLKKCWADILDYETFKFAEWDK